MTLNSKVLVDLPEKGIIVRRNGKYKAVYKVLRAFRNDKGQPTNERVMIGKLDEQTGKLIPNEKYYQIFGAADFTPAPGAVRSIGVSFLVDAITRRLGVRSALVEALGAERAELALTAAQYILSRGNVFEGALEYCEEFTLHEPPLGSEAAYSLFSSINSGEMARFFSAWLATLADGPYFAYDAMSYSARAKGVLEAEWGRERDSSPLPNISFSLYVSRPTGLPALLATNPDSILDKSALSFITASDGMFGITNACYVLGKEYCEAGNITLLDKEGLNFIMGVDEQTLRQAIVDARGSVARHQVEADRKIFASRVPGKLSSAKTDVHIFHDPWLAERQREDLHLYLESLESVLELKTNLSVSESEKYRRWFAIKISDLGTFTFKRDLQKISKASETFGTLGFITNAELGSSEVFESGVQKDLIERIFFDLINHVDMKRPHDVAESAGGGKMLCAFVALVLAMEMENKLGEWMRSKSWSRGKAVAELERIRARLTRRGRRLECPVTKTQSAILSLFDLTPEDVANYVERA
jgi:hypothetical protein